MSPFPITGMKTFFLTAEIIDQSARPLNPWEAVRGCTTIPSMPHACAISDILIAWLPDLSQPVLIFIVRGIFTVFRTSLSNFSAFSKVRISATPAPVLTTFLTEQPKLMSRISAPWFSTIFAASAIINGSEPNICMERGFSPGWLSSIFSVLIDL